MSMCNQKKQNHYAVKLSNNPAGLSNFEISYEKDNEGNLVKVVKDKKTKRIVSRTIVRKQLPVTGAVPEYIYLLSGFGLLSLGLLLIKKK